MNMSADDGRPAPEESPQFDFELIYPRPGIKVTIDQEPTGRSGHSMVTDGSNIYVLGGYNPIGRFLHTGRPTVLEELWKYNIATRKWKKMECTDFPATCASSSMVMRGKKIYVFGGTSYPFGQFVSNTFKVCDTSNPGRCLTSGNHDHQVYNWYSLLNGQPLPSGPENDSQERQDPAPQDSERKPQKGYGQSVIFHEEFIYTFGGAVGFYDEAIADVYRLNLHTITWEKMEPTGEVPDGRYKQEVIIDKHCFFIIGGGRLQTAQAVHILYAYSFTDNAWSKYTVAPHPVHGTPKPRSAFSLVQIDRDIYIAGGQYYSMTGLPEILNDMWHFSLDTFMWRKLPVSLPERMYFHRAVVTPSMHLFVHGGVLESSKRSNKMYRYRLPYQVAELKELCWFLVTCCWKDLRHAHPKDLREIYGIPQSFIDRLS